MFNGVSFSKSHCIAKKCAATMQRKVGGARLSHLWFASFEALPGLRGASALLLATIVFDCCFPEFETETLEELLSVIGFPLTINAAIADVVNPGS